jgi:hypothetical protein
MDGLSSNPGRDKIFSFPQHPNWLWDPAILLANMDWEHILQGLSDQGLKLTTYLHLVPK